MNMKSARWLMIVLILSSLLAAVTVDMVNPVLGLISESLQATKAQAGWVVTGITLLLAIGIPLYGRLADDMELRKGWFRESEWPPYRSCPWWRFRRFSRKVSAAWRSAWLQDASASERPSDRSSAA